MYGAPAPPRTHLTVVGASTRAGDLIGTGTISGPEPSSAACLLELTEAGQPHIALPDGTQRGWLEDGDEVTLSGGVRRDGTAILSFGQLSGRVAAAHPFPLPIRSEEHTSELQSPMRISYAVFCLK